MNVHEYYAYLCAAREQLWNFLRALPEGDLNRDLIPEGTRFHNIKDLLLHVTDVEDHWVHAIARRGSTDGGGAGGTYPHDWVRPRAEQYDLGWITAYGREVSARTRAFLDGQPDLKRPVKLVHDDPVSDTVSVDQLMWHVMTHEVRHTAQIALMIRQLGHTPPWLDYLRFARPQLTPAQSGGVDDLPVEGEDDEA